MLARIIAVTVALSAMACAGGADVDTGRAALANGERAPGLASVVALRTDGELFCSGTVVSERVVLTATHCLAGAGSTAVIEVLFGEDTSAPDEVIEVDEARRHPDWRFDSLSDDIALLALATNSSVPAMPMSVRALSAADENTGVTLVGFGLSALDRDDGGVRRSGEAPIVGVGDSQISINGGEGSPSACPGDSGGPSLLDGQIVGVHSRASCASLTQDERVDVHVADFIEPFIAEYPAVEDGCSASTGHGSWLLALLLVLAATGARTRCRSRARSASRRRRS